MDTSRIESMNLCTSDARPDSLRQSLGHPQRPTIDAGVLGQIEQELEEFEKIAIVFLLAAEYPASYRTVLRLCKNANDRPCILAEYVQNNLEVWSDKLVEALCVIGNHEVLQNLGYPEPSELSNKYQASTPRYAVKINVAVKVLYKLFESLTSEKTKQLLQNVYNEGKIMRELQDTHYLELHALYWLQERYITISPDGTVNFSNLLKHLKQLGYYSKTIYHDVEHFCRPIRAPNALDSCSQGKPNQRQESNSQNDVRVEDQKNIPRIIQKGLCVIINEVNFPYPYKRRDGSDSDCDNLRKTFSRINFDILIRENLDKDQTKQLIKEVSENFDGKLYDCLVVCILSHGYEGGIVTCDGNEIPIKEIEDKVCTWKLRNVIKLLIVQACQGKSTGDVSGKSDLATDGPRKSGSAADDSYESALATDGPTENILRYKHFSRFMSTMDRFVSIRHKKLGSWFIEAVCQELSKSGTISLSQWSLNVIANVQSREGNVDGLQRASQIPEFSTRLAMMVYFSPYVDNEETEPAVSA